MIMGSDPPCWLERRESLLARLNEPDRNTRWCVGGRRRLIGMHRVRRRPDGDTFWERETFAVAPRITPARRLAQRRTS